MDLFFIAEVLLNNSLEASLSALLVSHRFLPDLQFLTESFTPRALPRNAVSETPARNRVGGAFRAFLFEHGALQLTPPKSPGSATLGSQGQNKLIVFA